MTTITLNNSTDETLRIAIYKKRIAQPTLDTIAWQIVDPGPGGVATVTIPEQFEVFGEYHLDPPKNQGPLYCTNTVAFDELTARFVIGSEPSQDQRAEGAVITQSFTDLVLNEVRIVNNFGLGVIAHVQKNGADVYAPQVLWPGGLMLEDLRETFYLAIVSQFVFKGHRLVDEELSQTETPILEGGVATITGSMWEGYSITKS